MANAKNTIRNKALELGFSAVGFAAARPDPKRTAALGRFLKDGRQGDMDWMARDPDRRSDPTALWPEARTVIALGLNYGPHYGFEDDPVRLLFQPERANVSVYARGRDYHDIVKKRLKQLGRWIAETHDAELKVFVDTAPVMEKPLAQQAGLGWQGKHTNLVSRQFGSWLFLGEIFTTLELAPDAPEPDHCGSCRACMDACPTGALDVAYQIDPRKCVSYLTIEKKDAIDPAIAARMGNRVYGCDDCLAACPWNKYAAPTAEAAFLPKIELTNPKLADLAQLDDASFRKVFAGSPIKRTGRDRFLRNVLIAIGNSGDPALRAHAEKLRDDASPLVAATARWATTRFAG